MTAHASAGPRSSRGDTGGGWYGWVVFASVMMMLLGSFHAMAGLVALFNDEYYLVTKNGLVVTADYTTWGWIHLLLGILVAAAGAAVMVGKTWGRVVAVIVAMASAVVNLAFLSAYPLWATIMIAVDVMVIYAVTANRQSYEEWQ
jgi:hypothetical protein